MGSGQTVRGGWGIRLFLVIFQFCCKLHTNVKPNDLSKENAFIGIGII